MCPTRSRGINRNSLPCFRKTFPAVCCGFIPTPSSVITALVAGGTLNSSAANFKTAVNGVASGTLNLIKQKRQESEPNVYNITPDSDYLLNTGKAGHMKNIDTAVKT